MSSAPVARSKIVYLYTETVTIKVQALSQYPGLNSRPFYNLRHGYIQDPVCIQGNTVQTMC